MAKKPNIQSVEERLAEIDRVILNTSQRGCELIRSGAPVSEIDVITQFLQDLYRRRDIILIELKKAGVAEKEAYQHIRFNEKGGLDS